MVKKLSNDIRIYPIYCLFGWDLLFYYAISTLFLLNVKHIDTSLLVLIEAIGSLGFCIMQIPVRIISSRFSNKQNIIIGLVTWIIGILFIMLSPNYIYIIIGRLLFALGNCFKSVSEISILHEPLTRLKRIKWFNIVFGKGLSSHMYVGAFGALASGILFSINPYVPMIISIVCILIALKTTLKFNNEKNIEKIKISESMYQLKKGIKHIKGSSRLKALFLYTMIYFGLVAVTSTYVGIYLEETGITPILYAAIFALFHIIQAICSNLEHKLEKKLKRKTLTVFSLTHVISFILVGTVGIFTKSIQIVTVLFVIQYGVMVMDRVARNKYITNFTSNIVRESILSINSIIEYFSRFIGLLVASFLLEKFDISTSYIIIGLVFLVLIMQVLYMMKNRLRT